MTFTELLQACGDGNFPMVDHPKWGRGTVTTIKQQALTTGCSVKFPGIGYDLWFHNDPNGIDNRLKYMHELSIVEHFLL